MNGQDRAELDRLKRRLESLQGEFDRLRMQAGQLEARLNQPPPDLPAPVAPTAVAKPALPPRLPAPSLFGSEVATPPPGVPIPTAVMSVTVAPVPQPPAPLVADAEAPRAAPAAILSAPFSEAVAPEVPGQAAPSGRGSFEMRLGTYWLARIGIVMLLTAMVFFGKYAYQNFIVQMGPGGKVALLYLAGATLLGLGTWLQRRQEQLRNYAQVLFAGGLAAVYFTTYAAHHITHLRVIDSPLLDGVLLLGWAGFMTWLADRKKSELLSLFAIGLAYYTATITQVGLFTLYSNLVLTAAAVVFLLRNRWAGLSFLSLLATYAGYVFWRFWHGGDWHWASPEEGLWTGVIFLGGYWVLFTSGVLRSRAESFAGPNRVLFLSLNNAAFFVLFVLTMLQVKTGGFWRFSLIYGAVLLGVTLLARRSLPAEPLAANAYLTQGLVLVTVGLIAKFSDLQLALVLAAESVVLLPLGTHLRNRVLQTGAYTSAALALLAGLAAIVEHDSGVLWLGVGVGALLFVNALWLARREAPAEPLPLRPGTSYFTLLALAVWLATTWRESSPGNLPVALALEAVALTASLYVFRVREVTLLGQLYGVIGLATWLYFMLGRQPTEPVGRPVALMVLTLGLIHWWQREGSRRIEANVSRVLQGLYALGVVGVLHFWLPTTVSRETWLTLSAGLLLALTVYGALTRAWLIAAAGQLFAAVTVWEFARQLWEGAPPWPFALAPIAGLALLSASAVQWFKFRPDTRARFEEPISGVSLAYRWVALFVVLAWVQEYIPVRERFWVFALLGAAVFGWAGWRRNLEGCLFGAVLTAAGFGEFWLAPGGAVTVYLPNLVALLVLLGQQQVARRLPQRFAFRSEWHVAMICVADVSLWHFVTRWVQSGSGGFYLTVGWAVLALALFLTGMGLRERMHRWLGLAVLAAALGRVVIYDVWKLETLYRIVSFFALGVVLLVLGFIYNRYQEKIRQWL